MSKRTHQKAFKANAMKSKSKTYDKYVRKSDKKSLLFQAETKFRPEQKNQDLISTALSLPLNAAFSAGQLLTAIAQGTGNGNRVGRKITIKSVQFRGMVKPAAGGGFGQNRILIVYDKQSNGAAPNITDILTVSGAEAMMNLNNAERFVVICDEITDSCQSTALSIYTKRYIKCNLDVMYSGTTASIADCTTGAIYAFVANTADVTTGVASTSDFYWRVRYVDT